MRTVAVIGGGLSGICGARSCLEEGLLPTIFEATESIGGHWSPSGGDVTGVFDNLLTNIPYYESVVSDILPLRQGPNLEHGKSASLFLSPLEWIDYINHVVESTTGLTECIRTNSRVTKVQRTETGYAVTVESIADGCNTIEFDRVIVASGRMQEPSIPKVKGLQNFRGRIMHSKEYRNRSQFRGESVLVVGGSISGTECAGDLSDNNSEEGPQSVVMITRKMKQYVIKERHGLSYTEIQGNSLSSLSVRSGLSSSGLDEYQNNQASKYEEELLSQNTEMGLPVAKNPKAPFPVSEAFINGVKDGSKLTVKEAKISEITADGAVVFDVDVDGKHVFDTIIFATGYTISLPMFDDDTSSQLIVPPEKRVMGLDSLNLYENTWTPLLPGCAFMFCTIVGSAFALVDMQARWIARVFADEHADEADNNHSYTLPKEGEMRAAMENETALPLAFTYVITHMFAERIGCSIDYSTYPDLKKCLLVGPFVPMQFRICGHGAVDNAVEMYRKAVSLSGVEVDDVEVSREDLDRLKLCLRSFQDNRSVPPGFEEAISVLELEMN